MTLLALKRSDELASLLSFLGIEEPSHSVIITSNTDYIEIDIRCDGLQFISTVNRYVWHEKLIELNVIQSDQIYTSYTLVLVADEPAKLLTSQFVK